MCSRVCCMHVCGGGTGGWLVVCLLRVEECNGSVKGGGAVGNGQADFTCLHLLAKAYLTHTYLYLSYTHTHPSIFVMNVSTGNDVRTLKYAWPFSVSAFRSSVMEQEGNSHVRRCRARDCLGVVCMWVYVWVVGCMWVVGKRVCVGG